MVGFGFKLISLMFAISTLAPSHQPYAQLALPSSHQMWRQQLDDEDSEYLAAEEADVEMRSWWRSKVVRCPET